MSEFSLGQRVKVAVSLGYLPEKGTAGRVPAIWRVGARIPYDVKLDDGRTLGFVAAELEAAE